MIKSNFLNILKKFNKQRRKRISMNEFHKLTGISLPITSRLFHNQVHGLSFDTINKLVKFFKVPPSSFITYVDRPLRLVLYDADKPGVESTIRRCGLDVDIPHSDEANGIAMTFIGHKSPVHIALVPTFPLYPSEIGFNEFYFDFGYQVFSDDGFVDDFSSFKLSYNQRFRYIFNHNFPIRLVRYIYSRMLLHSGFIRHNDQHKISVTGTPTVSESNGAEYYLKFHDITFKNTSDLIHIWKRQPNEYDTDHDKYRLVSSNVGQPIKIYDYTTNYFK